MKKLCLLIPSLQAGGAERVMSELAWYFSSKDGVEVHFIIYGISREMFYKVPEGIIIHKPDFSFNEKSRSLSTLRTMLYIRKEIKEIHPFSILSFGEYWNSFILISLLGLRYPLFISDRAQPGKKLLSYHEKLRLWFYPKAKGLILQTSKAKEIYLSVKLNTNITVIGNPVRSFPEMKGIEREKIVLMVGRLIKTKHQDILIEVFSKACPADWRLLIVGYDHLKQNNMDRLRLLAKNLNVSDRVIFLGKVENVDELYLRSSVFAFTSSSEGFPNVIGEAMAAGLPVVAFDCIAGPAEIINDGYDGYLVPLFDKLQFEQKLKKLVDDESLREKMGSNARVSISRFSSEKICEQFYNFIAG